MQAGLQLFLFSSFYLIFAERPSHHHVLATVGDEVDRFGRSMRTAECQQEEPLKAVLLRLGFGESQLKDLHAVSGVTWKACEVVGIDLAERRSEVVGSLDPRFADLPDLQYLDLWNTQVSGDIASLAKATKLEHLNLGNTFVSGDIASLANATKLEHLDLFDTHVRGNIAALANATKLKDLNLRNTQVSSDITALTNATKLKVLNLRNTQVSGDIASLAKATKLKNINLRDTQVSGDMIALRSTSLGNSFDIRGSKITCDAAPLRAVLLKLGLEAEQLTDLKNFKGVTWKECRVVEIDLSNCPDVSGSLDERFNELKHLERLKLENTNTSGDIGVLLHNTKLEKLVLTNTQVSGDLAALQKATQLKDFESFEVSKTKVVCPQEAPLKIILLKLGFTESQLKNLHAVKGVTWTNCKLAEMDLRNRGLEVSGSLDERFGELVSLEKLNLASTRAFGDFNVLRNNTKLKHVDMSGTGVSGDISTILSWEDIESVDLSRTNVGGQPDGAWQGCCKTLQDLNVARTKVTFVLPLLPDGEASVRMPKLTNLDLSYSPLNCDVSDFLKSFQHFSSLGSVQVAGCGLTGGLDGSEGPPSLVALDLASNTLSHVETVPPRCKSLILTGNPRITFSEGVLQRAMKDGVFMDLQNVSFDKQEAEKLFNEHVIQKTASQTVFNPQGGFACFDLTSSQLAVTPYMFAPEKLCSCSPGWNGSGTRCEMCPADFFKNDASEDCKPCPAGSKAPRGSTSPESCKCEVGELFNEHGELRCGCPAHQALFEKSCLPCADLHLDCASQGSTLLTARPLPGFVRLGNETRAFECLPPQERCNASGHSHSSKVALESPCADGYVGVMCMDCSSNFYAAGTACKLCQDHDLAFPNPWILVAIMVSVVAMGAIMGLVLWRSHTSQVQRQVRCGAPISEMKEQIQAQGPILLQHCQLWGVLSALRTASSNSTSSSFWEIPYIQTLQFSLSSLKGALNLQCKFDGLTVRFGFALMAPVVPLLVLSSCLVLEIFATGSGITAMLKAITILYIGGASGTSSLLSCQEFDGDQERLPANYTFRTSMPYILCTEHSTLKVWVDIIGHACVFGYAIVIPSFMLYLYNRQRQVLRSSRMITAAAAFQEGDLKVCLHEARGSTTDRIWRQDEAFTRCLVATAVSYISVLFRGRLVRLQVSDGFAIVTPIDVETGRQSSEVFDVHDVLSSVLESKDAKQEIKTLTGIMIAEMLRERCILQEAIEGDRVLRGAQQLLGKYRLGSNVWMEVVQKLVAVALVSMVTSADGFWNCLGVNLGMAAACAMVQAYVRPQVNVLQSFCFLCLALATLSFHYGWVWPSRAAFALPFMLMAVQGLTPDSPETLALRLWQELDTKMPALQKGEAVEITAETFSFI